MALAIQRIPCFCLVAGATQLLAQGMPVVGQAEVIQEQAEAYHFDIGSAP